MNNLSIFYRFKLIVFVSVVLELLLHVVFVVTRYPDGLPRLCRRNCCTGGVASKRKFQKMYSNSIDILFDTQGACLGVVNAQDPPSR